ncbi:MAG: hypothetical protein OK422_01455 [Thaumarchaeota archaeon]|nr:hypothetical protein [Nitrososphaerota archaeon]
MAAEAPRPSEIESQLRGKTLEVYGYFLKTGGPLGIREIQRDLGFSSPSVVVYHMEKLIALGIVERDEHARYVLARKVDVGVLNAFVTIGKFTLPRVGFYGAFFTTIALAYFLTRIDLYAIVGTFGGAIAFWYEAWRIWRRKPF